MDDDKKPNSQNQQGNQDVKPEPVKPEPVKPDPQLRNITEFERKPGSEKK